MVNPVEDDIQIYTMGLAITLNTKIHYVKTVNVKTCGTCSYRCDVKDEVITCLF